MVATVSPVAGAQTLDAAAPAEAEPIAVPPVRRRPRRVPMLPLTPAWPLTALLLFFPLWWALGLGVLIFPILAVPMLIGLLRMRRPIRVPPGFALWLLFLVVVLASLVALGYSPPGTVRGTALARLPAVVLRLSEYASLTVLVLFAGNLTERQMPQRRLIALLGWLFLVTVAGGVLGTVRPAFEFTSPVELLLPPDVRGDLFVRSLVHPSAAQLHHLLGADSDTPRAAAPWGYTNVWGNNYFILVVWFVVGWLVLARSAWRRTAALACLAVSAIPVLYSLNRGLWLALVFAAGYVAIRLALRGRLLLIAVLALGIAAGAALLSTTSAGTLVGQRIETGKSNSIREYTTLKALEAVPTSPVLGYGSTRNTLGSNQSIAVGHSADCPLCGNATIGSNGQVWLELYAHGLLGLALFYGAFLVPLWRYRHDRTPIGIAASLVLLLNLFASLYYNTLVSPLAFTFLSLVLVWRQEQFAAAPGEATR